nr:hypothetical protein [uncultured bacterium]
MGTLLIGLFEVVKGHKGELVVIKTMLLAAIFLAFSVSFGQIDQEAQERVIEAQRAEMKKLDIGMGKWEGSGWMQQGPEKQTFTGIENVQRKLGGLAILVEGKFTNQQNVVIHETLAVISYNTKNKTYDFSTYLASGLKGIYELTSTADGWQWHIPFTGGKIRYTTKLTTDTWFETGEMSQDEGKTWRKFFEMNLKRVQ